jgi:hypothetical protein
VNRCGKWRKAKVILATVFVKKFNCFKFSGRTGAGVVGIRPSLRQFVRGSCGKTRDCRMFLLYHRQ